MTNEEEVTFEKVFQAYNMTLDERDFYLSLLSCTKEIESSNRVVDPSEPLASYASLTAPVNTSYIYIDEDDTFPPFSSFKEAVKEPNEVVPAKGKPFDIVMMALQKAPNGVILFNGAISNLNENKWVDGIIKQTSPESYNIITNVYRFYEHLRDSERMYRVFDNITLKEDKTIRETSYSDLIKFEKYVEYLPPLTEQKKEDYIMQLVRKIK